MQPEFSPTPQAGEQQPANNAETGYNIPPNYALPELSPAHSQETAPSRQERSPIEMAPPVPMQPLPPIPAQSPLAGASADDSTITSSNPISANDDDMIEKEWVNRAKQILTQTKDDPYAREKAIGELQRDYLMKRYGKQLGSTAD